MSVRPPCHACKHATEYGRCRAFPVAIPEGILRGQEVHDEVLEGQVGAFVWEPAAGEEDYVLGAVPSHGDVLPDEPPEELLR